MHHCQPQLVVKIDEQVFPLIKHPNKPLHFQPFGVAGFNRFNDLHKPSICLFIPFGNDIVTAMVVVLVDGCAGVFLHHFLHELKHNLALVLQGFALDFQRRVVCQRRNHIVVCSYDAVPVGYHIYYSDDAFTSTDDDGVALKIVYPSQDGYMLNLLQAGASAHVAVVAVGTNGAKSPLSAVVPITGGEADTDADGIPDWYCDQYRLWGEEGENKDIADSDDDGDQIPNLNEFNNNTDPTNPCDPMPILNASSTTVIDAERFLIYGLEPGMTQANFESNYVSINGFARLNFNLASGGFGTGTRVGFTNNATDYEMAVYRIVIFGDVNGDANIDTGDAGLIVDYENFFIDWDPLVDTDYMTAADLNGDGNVDTADAGLIVDVENFLLTIDQTTGLTVPL